MKGVRPEAAQGFYLARSTIHVHREFGLDAEKGRVDDGRGVTALKRIAIFSILVAVLGGIVFFTRQESEPSYLGKSLSRWIRGLEYENVNPSDEQRAALRAMGEPAIDWLIATLQRRDSAIKQKFVGFAQHHAEIHNRFIAPRHVIPEGVYHAQAATALGEIGRAARAAIPALRATSTRIDRNYLVAARARASLIKIREESIMPLLAFLEDTHSTNWLSTNWFGAALTLRYIGPTAEAAVPFLVSGLQTTNARVRRTALAALTRIARRPDIAVPALIDCLQDKDRGIRRDAIDALCKFKDAKQQIVPLLLSIMQDSDNNAWLGAALGLEDLLDQQGSTIPILSSAQMPTSFLNASIPKPPRRPGSPVAARVRNHGFAISDHLVPVNALEPRAKIRPVAGTGSGRAVVIARRRDGGRLQLMEEARERFPLPGG